MVDFVAEYQLNYVYVLWPNNSGNTCTPCECISVELCERLVTEYQWNYVYAFAVEYQWNYMYVL